MTDDRQAFVRAVLAAPDDPLPRLIFADWLDEQGDPLGELIRVRVELAGIPRVELSETVEGVRRVLGRAVRPEDRERLDRLTARERELASRLDDADAADAR
jgi:uncharacterized protein (TIGR02996 family)